MKKIIICITFALASFWGYSQTEKLGTIKRNSKGVITSVTFLDSVKGKSPRSANDFFTKYLEVKETDHFEKVPHKSKRPDFVHDHYDQYYKEVKVAGAGYNLHFKDGQMYFANGNYAKVEGLNATPSLTEEDAVNSFLEFKNIEKEKVASNMTELIVKEISRTTSKDTVISVELVYRVYLQADHVNNDEIGFVNAHTGDVVATEPRLIDLVGTFATRYSGSRQADTDPVSGGHRLFDNTRGATIHTRNMQNNTTIIASAVELIDNDNNWTAAEHAANNNDMGLDVHWALQSIYDYLSNTHGINSFDDYNEPINAFVRYGDVDQRRDNAFWDPSIDVLYFGQGVSTFSPLASLDVVAHEFGHGITDFQIGWGDTFGQATFNEGMSDIWAAILEQRIRPSATWRIGEQVMANGKSYLRNLQNTDDNNADTKMADTFGSSQYNSGGTYEKSGVFSHWFYILANGESGTNGIGDSYNVTGIGLDLAEELIVEAVFNNYLDGTTTYPAIRTAMINAAQTIFCEKTPEIKAVTDAWYAVGVGQDYASYPSLSGSDSFCTSATYTLNNPPVNTTVNWSISPNGIASLVPSGNSVTVNKTGGGDATLKATYIACGSEIVFSKDISTVAKVVSITAEYNDCYNGYAAWRVTATPNFTGASNWHWTVDNPSSGSWYIDQPNSSSTWVEVNGGGGITVTYQSPCGGTSEPNGVTIYSSCSSSFNATIYPNPATGNTITIDVQQSQKQFSQISSNKSPLHDERYIKEVEIYNIYGTLMKKQTFENNRSQVQIDIPNLPTGIYFVKISDGTLREVLRLTVKKM